MKSMKYVIGLDLGTTSISAVAIEQSGKTLAAVNHAHEAAITSEDDRVAVQSTDLMLQVSQKLIREIVQFVYCSPSAIGLTGQMHGFVCCDASGFAISDFITWQDKRVLASSDIEDETWLSSLQKRLPENLQSRLGCQIRPGYALATLDMLNRSGQLQEKLHHISDITDWIGSQLTSTPARIDPTFAASWGVYNLQQKSIYQDVIRAAGLKPKWFPLLESNWKIRGTTTTQIAREWNLAAGVPVLNGIGDHPAAVRATIQNPENDLLMNVGTGGQIAWCTKDIQPTDEIEVRPFSENLLLNVGAGSTGGEAWFWFAESVQQWFQEMGVELSYTEVLERLNRLSQVPADLNNIEPVYWEPFFQGTRNETSRRASISNIGRHNFNLSEMARGLLSGIVDSLYRVYQNSKNPITDLKRLIVSGNYFEHHEWLAQYLANRYRIDVVTPDFKEQSAVGAAMLAGREVFRNEDLWNHFPISYRTLAKSSHH
ncbi:MAG TPA: hypothetical protein DD473_21670 [Planctomycetaceae bacterium]|nr:hypothetical protein [Planctomycetaceae bacterium]|tara:strand:+ start:1152 stop:2606 length:1455 start_codon:yes stop_codon:yes gene_type:complete